MSKWVLHKNATGTRTKFCQFADSPTKQHIW